MPETPAERYELRDEIARGGMGVVHRAHDRVLNREVGLKTLREVPAAGSSLPARFREEARITGQLQHPSIPPVHDLGTLPDGRPFLAMKLIKGQTLEALLKERPDPAHDRGRFLAVFEQIAHGVAYAHAHKIIHRDLKPLNVMVGAFGEVQVVDWGLAKVLTAVPPEGASTSDIETGPTTEIRAAREDDERTRAGSVFGTPAYMPREQAIGAVDQIDERSDVFSLGGILCAILTDQPPYVGANSESTRQLAAVAKLDDTFARLKTCGAEQDLIALCRRCLSAERDDRPQNAGVVAKAIADLRARAEQRARQAELDRVRAAEQRKRWRVQMLLALAVGLLLLSGGGFAFWKREQDDRAKLKQSEFDADLARQETVRVKADAARVEAEHEARERQRELQAGRDRNRDALHPLLERSEAALRAGDAYTAGLAIAEVEKRARESGVEDLTPRVERCRADLAVLAELDRIEDFRWTPVDRRLPDRSVVAARWRAVFAEFGIALGTTPPAEAGARLKASLVRERLLGALDLWLLFSPSEELAAILTAADPNDYRDTVRAALAAGKPELVLLVAGHPAALEQPVRFAVPLAANGSVPLARTRAILERAVAAQPGELAALMGLGELYAHVRATVPERLRWYQAAVAAHPRYAAAHINLGVALAEGGNLDAAAATFRTAIACDPNNVRAHGNLAGALLEKGDLAGATAACRTASDIDPTDANAHMIRGNVLLKMGDVKGAIAQLTRATQLDPKKATAHSNLGVAFIEGGEWAKAVASLETAIRLDPTFAGAYANLGNALMREGKGDLRAATASYRKAIQLETDVRYVPGIYFNLGRVLAADKDAVGAIASFQQAIKLNPKHAPAHNSLGFVFRTRGDLDAAIDSFKRSMAADPKYPPPHFNLGRLLLEDKKDAVTAILHLREATRLDPQYVNAFFYLGTALGKTGDVDGAIASAKQALAIDPSFTPAKNLLEYAEKKKRELDMK